MPERHWFWFDWGFRYKVWPPTPNGHRYVELELGPYKRSWWRRPAYQKEQENQ